MSKNPLFLDIFSQYLRSANIGALGILRLQRQEETDELIVVLDELESLGARADLPRDPVQLVGEDVAQPLREDQRQDIFLVFWRILRTADRTRRIPDLLL